MEASNGPRPPRRTDTWLVRLLILSVFVNLITLPVAALNSTGVIGNGQQIDDTQDALDAAERGLARAKVAVRRVREESRERVQQDCLKEERDHLKDVKNLRRTYRFLLDYPVEQRTDPLFVAIIQTLPQTESAAKTDNAPPYCDDPHIGLPEPDPKLPRRPPALAELVG